VPHPDGYGLVDTANSIAPGRGCRLRRHDAGGERRIEWRGEAGAAVRRRARGIELHLCRGHLDAESVRSSNAYTLREHMPSSHRRYADWTPERLRRQAGEIGRHTSALIDIILRERTHPEQGFRAWVGIVRLAKTRGPERLESACCRALEIGARSYSSINSLENNLDAEWLALLLDRSLPIATACVVPTAGHLPLDRRSPQSSGHRPCGLGKSWLSCALAQKACRDGYTVYYARVPRLFADLDLSNGDGRFARPFRMLVKVDLLVLEDWGLDRLSASQRRDLMEIVEDRYGRGSILITRTPCGHLA
jgi:hypothetical protein